MILAIICWVIALAIFVHPKKSVAQATTEEETNTEREGQPSVQGFVYALVFLFLCNFFGVPVFGGSDDDADNVTLTIESMATSADADLEPLAFIDWLHARPEREDDSGVIKSIDRANAPAVQELDVAHAKPYKIVHTQPFPSNSRHKRMRLYAYAPQAVTQLQRAQTAIRATLDYTANYYKKAEVAGDKAWEVDLWLVAYPEKISTYTATSSYYRQGRRYDGTPAEYIMQLKVLDLPYSELAKGENYAADMNVYLTMHLDD